MYSNELRVNAFNEFPAVFILVKTALIIIMRLDANASTQHV